MGLLARMTVSGKTTTGMYSDLLPLRFQAMGWQEQYARQLADDGSTELAEVAEANTQTLAQLERDAQARQAEQKGA